MTRYSFGKSMCGIILVLIATGGVSVVFADEPITGNDRIEVLKTIIAHNEANRRKIETWEGTYQFVDRFPRLIPVQVMPDKPSDAESRKAGSKVEERKVIMIREGLVNIALDMAGNKLWTDFREDAARTKVVQPDAKEVDVVEKPKDYMGYEQRTVLLPDSKTVLVPNAQYGPVKDIKGDPLQLSSDKSGRLAERRAFAPTLKQNDTDEIIDPRNFYMEGTMYIGEFLTVTLDALMGKYGEEIRTWIDQHIKIRKSGAPGALEYQVTQQYRNSSAPELDAIGLSSQVVRYSEHEGFLPIEDRKIGISGEPQMTRSWRYQRTDGIFVPSEYHYTFNSFNDPRLSKGASLVLDRRLILVDVSLNGRLPEKIFAADGLKLEEGDRLVDRIEQKLYVHDGAHLVPASQYSESQQRTRGWLLWLNSAALILLVTILGWQRWRRRKVPEIQPSK